MGASSFWALLVSFRWNPVAEVRGQGETHRTAVPVLLPHEVLHALSNASSFAFESITLGNLNDKARVGFWKHIRTCEPWRDHPSLQHGSPLSRLIGFTYHGDGAQFYREDEFFVWSFASVFGGQGSIKDVLLYRFPLCIIPERFMKSHHVRDAVHRTIAELASWSTAISSRGIGPAKGFHDECLDKTPRAELIGKELAKGWKRLFWI